MGLLKPAKGWVYVAELSQDERDALCPVCIPPVLDVFRWQRRPLTVQTISDRFVVADHVVHDMAHAAELLALHEDDLVDVLAEHGPIRLAPTCEQVLV